MIRAARANPFRTAEIDHLEYYCPELSLISLVDRLQQLNQRAMLVGPHGSGKSTLLRCIATQLSGRYNICNVLLRTDHPNLNSSQRQNLRQLSNKDFLLVDGFEQLSSWAKFRLMKWSTRAGGVLLTSHVDGPLPSLHSHRNSLSTTTAMVEKVLTESLSPCLRSRISHLHRQHGDDMRSVFQSLYNDWATSDAPTP